MTPRKRGSTAETRAVALLRGVNVGGNNLIAKDDLKQCFEDLGFTNVRTYIQSGNVLFRSGVRSVSKLTKVIERGLSDRFSFDARAVVLRYDQYVAVVESAPPRWGHVATRKHNALFTLGDLAPEDVLAQLPAPLAGIETVTAGSGVIFWSASTKHLAKTTMMKLAKSPLYRQLTVRNQNTVFKLRELLEEL